MFHYVVSVESIWHKSGRTPFITTVLFIVCALDYYDPTNKQSLIHILLSPCKHELSLICMQYTLWRFGTCGRYLCPLLYLRKNKWFYLIMDPMALGVFDISCWQGIFFQRRGTVSFYGATMLAYMYAPSMHYFVRDSRVLRLLMALVAKSVKSCHQPITTSASPDLSVYV